MSAPPARSGSGASQAASAVLMVRPAVFYGNPDTAASNAFQRQSARPAAELTATARREFDAVAQALARAGVEACVVEALADEDAPDALFPNNWISTAPDGTVTLYPLHAANRRRERRLDVVHALSHRFGFAVERVIDLSRLEEQGQVIEGTGSLVLDHQSRTAYVCRSPRSTDAGIAAAARALGCQVVAFAAADEVGRAIYHTNVMLGIGGQWAVLCLEAIESDQRRPVAARLAQSHELITITRAQLAEFCGNVLELKSRSGTPLLAVSERAWAAFTPAQRSALERHARPIAVAIPTIETVGGGGIRCLLAEIFLPRRGPGPGGPGV